MKVQKDKFVNKREAFLMKSKKLLVLGFAILFVLSVLFSGCSKQQTTPSENTSQAKSQDEQVLNVNLGEEPPMLDPQKSTDAVSFEILNATLEGLVRLNKEGKVEKGSGLAKDWEISPDGLKYTFHLRDAKWSDGTPITAYDFEYAWKRALAPETASQYAYMLYYLKNGEAYNSGKAKAEDVGVKALDDKTLEVTLEKPAPQFLGLTSFITYLPAQKAAVEKYGDKYGSSPDTMVYSGPFMVKEWNHEQNMVLVKNPNYWDKDNVKLEKINMDMVKDDNTVIQNYEAGQYDAIGVPGQYIDKYKNDPNFHQMAMAITWYLQFNNKSKIFSNVNMRKAFTYAVDRKAFVDNILKNGSIPALSFVPPGIPGEKDEFRKEGGDFFKDNDVATAKELLAKGMKELGITQLPKIKFVGGDSDAAKKHTQALQEFWNKNLGVSVDIVNVAFKVRLDMMDKGDYDIVYAGWGADYNDPMTFMDLWVTGGGNNTAFYSNPKYDELIKKANSTNDNSVRMQAMHEAEKILMEDMPIGPLYFAGRAYLQRPYVKDWVRFPVGVDNEWKWTYIEGKNK